MKVFSFSVLSLTQKICIFSVITKISVCTSENPYDLIFRGKGVFYFKYSLVAW